MEASIRVILTGATGMVGEGVLHYCLGHPQVSEVLVISRKPCGLSHAKLKEILHQNFFDLSPIESQLAGYDACLFCLGVSSVGMKATEYFRLTYTLTMRVAEAVSRQNPSLVFCYISGAGTDSTEKGRSRWARVKGKTENDLRTLPFASVFAFRPGFIRPMPHMQHTHRYYTYINWLFPIGRKLFPKAFCTLEELARAMIHVCLHGYPKSILEGDDIIQAAAQ